MPLKDELEALVRQNELLTQSLGLLSGRQEASFRLLSTIAGLSGVTAEAGGLPQAAERVLTIVIQELQDVEACSILVYQPESETLAILAGAGAEDLVEPFGGGRNRDLSFQLGEGAAGKAFVEQKPLFWDRRHPEGNLLKTSDAMRTPESLACLPLSFADRRLGVLNISFGLAKPFDYPRKRGLILLSGVVSNILQTFHLRDQLAAKNADLEKAREELQLRMETRTAALVYTSEELKQEAQNRRQADAALAESEARYRLLVERTNDGFFIVDPADGGFRFLNAGGRKLLGLPADGPVQKALWDFAAPFDREAVKSYVRRSAAAPIRTLTFTAVADDGRAFPAQLDAGLADLGTTPVVQGVLRGVSGENAALTAEGIKEDA